MSDGTAGKCRTCRYADVKASATGSLFLRCGLSDTNPDFARYPPLPVLSCAGFEQRAEPPTEGPKGN